MKMTNDNEDDPSTNAARQRQERVRERIRDRRMTRYSKDTPATTPSSSSTTRDVTSTTAFVILTSLLVLALVIQFVIVFGYHHVRHDERVLGHTKKVESRLSSGGSDGAYDATTAHLYPKLPPLPPILNIEEGIYNSQQLIDDVLSGERPTISGMALVLSRFIKELRASNKQLANRNKQSNNGGDGAVQRDEVHEAFVKLATQYLTPLEDTYRNREIFPLRSDESIYISLASFRDHMLRDTLMGAFDQATHPNNLFVGVIVQNCFGLHPYPGEVGSQCKTGAQVVGKGPGGHDITKVSDAPPDNNGVEEFCNSSKHSQYCTNGQIRVLYIHEDESLGPAMARYYASKLYGGETYFMQVDAHLEFYVGWDTLYINELKCTKSYPKSMLSSYPPGFNTEHGGILNSAPSPGARLCSCEFSDNDVEEHIIRLNSGNGYNGDEMLPTQIPFVAAGFFFTPSRWLVDVPFDPYLPWCFMGEEIMLSMRTWTAGWDIYAPRKNWIAHQYRPGRMGLPKFWGSVGRMFGRPGPSFSNQLQKRLIKRVKYLVGYTDCCTKEKLQQDGDALVLQDVEHYGMGNVRSREAYLKWAKIDVDAKKCHVIQWCNKGELL
jgi:[Skp1-protein]-hydroxyproline N-acetylglucosaminyltransferase